MIKRIILLSVLMFGAVGVFAQDQSIEDQAGENAKITASEGHSSVTVRSVEHDGKTYCAETDINGIDFITVDGVRRNIDATGKVI